MDTYSLESLIKRYAQSYYEGHAEVDDDTFDTLVDELRSINPESEILSKIGWGYDISKVSGLKVRHKYQEIGSLQKYKDFDKLVSNFRSNIVVSGKIDGISLVSYFRKGKLVRAVTRGNGSVGLDKTDKLIAILPNISADSSFTGAIRGELVISRENWKSICSKYPAGWEESHSPRNYVSGIINRDYIDDEIRYVSYVVYNVIGAENDSMTSKLCDQVSILDFLKNDCRFDDIVPYFVSDAEYSYSDLVSFFEEIKEIWPVDGLVITKQKTALLDSCAVLYYQVSFKFQSERKLTTVTDVTWTLTRTGRYVPVINFETIELCGARISNATGYNAKYIADNGIGVGSVVEIERSNEVIPKVISVIEQKEPSIPTKCPSCDHKLTWNGTDLVCMNPECGNKDFRDLQNWMIVLGSVDGIGWTLMEKFLDEMNISSIRDLYMYYTKYGPDSFDTKGSKQRELFAKSLDKVWNLPVDPVDALCALNIKRLGRASAEKIVSVNGLLEFLYNLTVPIRYLHDCDTAISLLKKTVGPTTTESIISESGYLKLTNLRYIVDRITRTDSSKKNDTDLIKVCITGKLSCKRSQFEQFLKEHGYVNAPIGKDTKFLITDDPNSGSSKNKAADKLGVEKISEQEFRDMVS